MNVPIRVRMTAWYVALLAMIIAAVGAFLVVRLRADLTGAVDGGLRPDAAQIAADVRKEGAPEFPDAANTVLTGERPTAQLLTADGTIISAFGDPVARAPMLGPGERASALAGRPVTVTRALGRERQAFRLTAHGAAHDGRRYLVVAGASLEPVERSVRRLVFLLLLAGPVALLATAAGGWWLARRALRPVERMASTAAAIGVDRLDDRVPEPRTRDELAYLARTLNTMLDRIRDGVQEQRRLVADASHELRTPLAAMRSEIDVSLRADALPPAARDVLTSAREEVDRLSRTVDDLLTLATVDGDGLHLITQHADVADVARAVTDALDSLARSRGVTVERRGEPALVRVDADRVAHAVRNVIENAIEFSPAGGTVVVTTAATGATGRLVVEDEGPGVPAELRERIFDRFFRADPSRTRRTGGSGLGLAITREIVAAHGGDVHVEERAHGSAFVIDLPAAAGASPHTEERGYDAAASRRDPRGSNPRPPA
jgi:two-component system OmpR family sensor kinase